MADFDVDVRFDRAAADRARMHVQEAIRVAENELEDRRRRHATLQTQWSGYAKDWYNERSASFDVVAAGVVEYLRGLIRGIVAQQNAADAEQRSRLVKRVERDRAEAEARRLAALQPAPQPALRPAS
jgi:hypothetical protein